jgi:hypothetical protein
MMVAWDGPCAGAGSCIPAAGWRAGAGETAGWALLALLIGLAGVLVSPALATAYVLADSQAAATARNRAGNWVSSGYNAGSSAGSALSGQMVGRIPLSACPPALAAAALLAIVPPLRARLTPAAEQQSPPDGPPEARALDREDSARNPGTLT